jgi:hypothetical protein
MPTALRHPLSRMARDRIEIKSHLSFGTGNAHFLCNKSTCISLLVNARAADILAQKRRDKSCIKLVKLVAQRSDGI